MKGAFLACRWPGVEPRGARDGPLVGGPSFPRVGGSRSLPEHSLWRCGVAGSVFAGVFVGWIPMHLVTRGGCVGEKRPDSSLEGKYKGFLMLTPCGAHRGLQC